MMRGQAAAAARPTSSRADEAVCKADPLSIQMVAMPMRRKAPDRRFSSADRPGLDAVGLATDEVVMLGRAS